MSTKYIFVLGLLSSCGAPPEGTQQGSALTSPSGAQAATGSHIEYQTPALAKDVTVQYEKIGGQFAIALNDQSELPSCTKDNDRQLAYTRKEDKFFACENTIWTEIDVKGKDGAEGATGASGKDGSSGADGTPGSAGQSGTQGSQGSTGAQGIQGVQGIQGPTGPQGPEGEPTSANEWHDPVAKTDWLIGASSLNLGLLQNYPPCTGDWRLPTLSEAHSAVLHGIALASHALQGPQTFWTSDSLTSGCGTGFPTSCRTAVDAQDTDSQPNSAGIACIKVPL